MPSTPRNRALVMVALLLVIPLAGSASAGILALPTEPVTLASGRTPHPAIAIRGDSEICKPGSGVVNCGTVDGSSWANAYEIRGWDVSGTSSVPALFIGGTTKHIIVHSNGFKTDAASEAGTVVFTTLKNLRFENNVVSGTRGPALDVRNVNASTAVTGNTLTQVTGGNGTHALLKVQDAPDLTVKGNVLRAADDAWNGAASLLRADYSNRLVLDGNRYGPLNGTGVVVANATNVTSVNETFNTTRVGLVAEYADGLNVTGADMNHTLDGMRVYGSLDVAVSSSSIVDNWPCDVGCVSATGIYAQDSTLSVDNVLVESFDDGIVLVSSTATTSTASTGTRGTTASGEDTKDLTARYVTLRANGNGLVIGGDAKVMVKWSNFEGNDIGIWNKGSQRVGAAHNWWGCAEGPGTEGCDPVQGGVEWTPHARSRFPLR